MFQIKSKKDAEFLVRNWKTVADHYKEYDEEYWVISFSDFCFNERGDRTEILLDKDGEWYLYSYGQGWRAQIVEPLPWLPQDFVWKNRAKFNQEFKQQGFKEDLQDLLIKAQEAIINKIKTSRKLLERGVKDGLIPKIVLGRAESYWLAHLETALINNSKYFGKSMVTMEDTIEEIGKSTIG